MEALVTGGAGFIGSHLVDSLIDRGHKVYVIDDLSTGKLGNLNSKSVFEKSKLSTSILLPSIFEKIDFIFHLAGRGSIPKSILNPALTFDVNFNETLFLVNLIKECPVPILFASSSSVYGASPIMPRSVNNPIYPISPYAASKAAAEMLLLGHSNAYSIPLHIARFFNVYGPRQDSDSDYAAVIPKFINNIKNGENLIIHGDGNQSRDFTFVLDLVNLLIHYFENGFPQERISNFAFGTSTSVNNVAETLIRIAKSKVSKVNVSNRIGDVPFSQSEKVSYTIDNWPKPHTSIEDGLKITYESYL